MVAETLSLEQFLLLRRWSASQLQTSERGRQRTDPHAFAMMFQSPQPTILVLPEARPAISYVKYIPTATYQVPAMSAPSSPEQYNGNTYIPMQRIDVQPVNVPGVNMPVTKASYLAGGPTSASAAHDPSSAFHKRAGGYVLLPAPTWTAIPTGVHAASTSQSVSMLVQASASGTAAGCDTLNVSQPPQAVIAAESNAMALHGAAVHAHHHHAGAGYATAAHCGGFAYPQVTPMSSPESQGMTDNCEQMSAADAEAHRRFQLIRQSLKNEIVRSSVRVREPRPRQEKCACPDNSCLAGRDSRPPNSTRNHYSCKTATKMLMDWIDQHQENPYPDREEKKRLAKQACMTVKQLADWFGNARRRKRRQQQDDLHMANRERELQMAT